jgi:asparagine synthase (glutamine-hydrolysing)
MCGIAGLILKSNALSASDVVLKMTDAIRHRGPDGEGYLLAGEGWVTPFSRDHTFVRMDGSLQYLPSQQLAARENTTVAFGHRRLSIIDLSEAGHQPMCDPTGKTWITYNGELYNYIELRDELKALGHSFRTECDTEVVIAAYRQWSTACVTRFNGMWGFCIYDSEKKICFASRDRLGVKPFYYSDNKDCFAFASEQKAIVKVPGMRAEPRHDALRDYLIEAALERSPANFFEGIFELWPGHNLVYDLSSHRIGISRYFHLNDCVSWANEPLPETALIEKIREGLDRAVRLRLRSDVEVGTCLSGGIDSSALVALMSKHVGRPVSCFTAAFPGEPFNEERYAEAVAKSVNGKHYKTTPTLEGFLNEVDDLVYAQDIPIWDTSTYAQHKVMQLAKDNHIKVVLDGQGADELFAGYHHHFIAKWNGLLREGKLMSLYTDLHASNKTFPHPFLFYLRHRRPRPLHGERDLSHFFTEDFLEGARTVHDRYLHDVNSQLIDDIYHTRLKSFLKCEDRCGMWHSVESRTPFSDDTGLFSLLFSFNGSRKIRKGVSKYLLREAVKPELPKEIYQRYDKKGFETPMQKWVRELRPRMIEDIRSADFSFISKSALEKAKTDDPSQNRILFRLFMLARWKSVFVSSSITPS